MAIHGIMKKHADANDMGHGFFHQDDDDEHHFYHMKNGKIDALSTVNSETMVHGTFYKEAGVDSSVPLQNFSNALNHFGRIQSDSTHTKGSKHFWMSLHDKIPGIKIYVSDEESGIATEHDKDSLKKNADSIWGSSNKILHASLPDH
jgi:hypothetical protein